MRLARTLGLAEAGRALRDFATYLPTQVIPAIAGVLVLPILARELAPSELGVLAIAQTLITLGWTAAGSWLTTTLIRELPAARQAGNLRPLLRADAARARAQRRPLRAVQRRARGRRGVQLDALRRTSSSSRRRPPG